MVAAEGASSPALGYDDMPAAFRVSDRVALQSQRKTVRWTGWQLTMLVVAAAVAFIPWEIDDSLHVGGLLSFFAFAIAFGLALRLATERPMGNWYEGRAGAESVKTLAWRYAVGGEPFPLPEAQVDERFEARLREVMSQLSDLRWREAASAIRSRRVCARCARGILPLAQLRMPRHGSATNSNGTTAKPRRTIDGRSGGDSSGCSRAWRGWSPRCSVPP